MAYIYTYKFMYIVLAERGVLDDPPEPPLATGLPSLFGKVVARTIGMNHSNTALS